MSSAQALPRRRVLVLGASSVIAQSLGRALAQEGYDLILAGRDADELERIAADTRLRYGAAVSVEPFDALAVHTHEDLVRRVIASDAGALSGAVVVFGEDGDGKRELQSATRAAHLIQVNYLGAVSVLTPIANYLESQSKGFIVGVSSVAGDRGRQSNYVYGSAKGGLSLFLQGLRNRLHRAGVQVLTVKAGYIDTRMTFGRVRSPLSVNPDVVARAVCKALRRNRSVIYVPWFWRFIMLVIRSIPEFLFKRTRL